MVSRVRFKSSETLISKTILVETCVVSIVQVGNIAVPWGVSDGWLTDVRRKYQVHDWFQMAVNTSFLSSTLMIISSFHYVSDLKFLKSFNREYALTCLKRIETGPENLR